MKYIGAFIGSTITKEPKEVKRYLGLALIPQAGVAIGLAVLASRMLPEDMANMLSTIILASSVLYEFIGPGLAKLSLFLSGSIKRKTEKEPVGEGTVVEVPTISENEIILRSSEENN